jgi:hypothetical protein
MALSERGLIFPSATMTPTNPSVIYLCTRLMREVEGKEGVMGDEIGRRTSVMAPRSMGPGLSPSSS